MPLRLTSEAIVRRQKSARATPSCSRAAALSCSSGMRADSTALGIVASFPRATPPRSRRCATAGEMATARRQKRW
jgi:hypothetical protein